MVPTKITIIAILLAVATSDTVATKKIPEFLHICDMKVENYVECVKKSINDLLPVLRNGLPEYNLPKLEPMILKKLQFNGSLGLRVETDDTHIHGSGNFSITNLRINSEEKYFELDIDIPKLVIDGDISIEGELVIIKLKSSGKFSGNFTNNKGFSKIKCETYTDSNGVVKIRINKFKLIVTVGEGALNINLQRDSNGALNEAIASSINNNFQFFLSVALPSLEKALSKQFTALGNKFVEQFSFDELFPNNSEVRIVSEGLGNSKINVSRLLHKLRRP